MSHSFEEGKNAAREVKDTLKEGAAQVGNDVRVTARDARSAVENVTDVARASAPTLASDAKAKLDDAKAKIDDFRAQTEEVLEDLYEDTITQIRARPLSAVLIAALGGAVLALLARRAMV